MAHRIRKHAKCDVTARRITWIVRFSSGNHDKGFIDSNLWSSCDINRVVTSYTQSAALNSREVLLSIIIPSLAVCVPFIHGMDRARSSLKLFKAPGCANRITNVVLDKSTHTFIILPVMKMLYIVRTRLSHH
jgi:hypothetical protein